MITLASTTAHQRIAASRHAELLAESALIARNAAALAERTSAPASAPASARPRTRRLVGRLTRPAVAGR